jgi:hypothetical protein
MKTYCRYMRHALKTEKALDYPMIYMRICVISFFPVLCSNCSSVETSFVCFAGVCNRRIRQTLTSLLTTIVNESSKSRKVAKRNEVSRDIFQQKASSH